MITDISSMTLRLLPRALGAQGQRQASFLGGIFGSGEKKAGIATEATFDYHPFKLHQLDEGPATTTTITRDEALRIYREMVTVRYVWRINNEVDQSMGPQGSWVRTIVQEDGDCSSKPVQGEGHQRLLPSLLRAGGCLLWHESWDQGAGFTHLLF